MTCSSANIGFANSGGCQTDDLLEVAIVGANLEFVLKRVAAGSDYSSSINCTARASALSD